MSEQYHTYYAISRALVVGINSYADPRLMPLGQAEADAEAMAAALSAEPYNFQVKTLLGQAASKTAILQALFHLRATGPDDRVLVYFAGHGYTLVDKFNNETGYLATVDTIPEQDFTALALDEVTGLRRHAEAKHIAFVFDACFSGQALGLTRAPGIAAEKYLERRAYQVISAGAGDQTVRDAHSMTRYLLDGLRSPATSEEGLYTLSKLGLFVQAAMAADSSQMQIPQFGHLQGSQGGDFVLWMDTRERLPGGMETALRSGWTNIRLGVVAELKALAESDDERKAQLARERLAYIVEKDPEERVRAAARAILTGDAAGPAAVRTGSPADETQPSPARPAEETIICPACGAENPITARRCMNCGLALGKTCPVCNTLNPPGAERCESCDTPLDMLAALAAREGDGKRRSEVSRAKLVAAQKADDMAFMEAYRQSLLADERDRQEAVAVRKRQSQRQLELIAIIAGVVLIGLLVVLALNLAGLLTPH